MVSNPDTSAHGGSLVGTLMVLVVLGGLATLVVTSLPSGETQNLLRGGSKPSAPGSSVSGSPPGARSPGPGKSASLTGTAAAAACAADVRSVEVAVAAEHATAGRYPSTIGELVAGRWLSQAPAVPGYQLSLQVVAGNPTGQVLVNGQPAASGCDTSPSAGG